MVSIMNRVGLMAFACAILTGCQDRQFTALGYRFGSQFDPCVKSVAVPIFRNVSDQTTPYRNLEADLTQAVVREINTRPGMRIVSDPDAADSVLTGTVISVHKLLLNRNQQNQWRDGEVIISASVVWKAKDGRILSNRRRPDSTLPDVPAFDPSLPPPVIIPVEEQAVPVAVIANGRLIPELGESNATAQQIAIKQLARQIVNLMEEPW
jgi:hypothetical protein